MQAQIVVEVYQRLCRLVVCLEPLFERLWVVVRPTDQGLARHVIDAGNLRSEMLLEGHMQTRRIIKVKLLYND